MKQQSNKQPNKHSKILAKRNPNITQVKQQPQKLQQMPTIETMLSIPNSERSKKAYDYFRKVKPFLQSFIQKKQGSRVAQLIYKWGSQDTKAEIHKIVLQNWKELIKSKYALFLMGKILKDFQFPQLFNDFLLLQNNREGAQIIQNYIQNNSEEKSVVGMKRKIYALHEEAQEGNIKSQELLHNLGLKSIQKNYHFHTLSKIILKLSIPSMFEEEKQKAIDYLIENVSDIVSDEDGIKLFIELVNHCSAKQKKALIKQFKGHIKQVVDNNNISYVSVIKLATETDDTVTIGKTLVLEILELLPEIQTNKKLFNLVLSLLTPRNNSFNCLGNYEKEVLATFCKKPEQQRQKQVKSYLYDPLIEFLTREDNIEKSCKDIQLSRLTLATVKALEIDGDKRLKKLVNGICENFLNNWKENMDKKGIDSTLLGDNFGSKLIKNILLLQQSFMDSYCDKFTKILTKDLPTVLNSKASFVLSVLVEKGGRDWVLTEIKKSRVNLDNAKAGKFYKDRISQLK